MNGLPDYDCADPAVDTLSADALHALQSERLRAMVRYVYAEAPFWRRKFDAVGLVPGDLRGIEDLPRIPFCTKAELQEDQAANPPLGSYVCTPRQKWLKFFQTSGTTGRPLLRIYSARDWHMILQRFMRVRSATPGDIAVVLGPVDGLIGPTASVDSMAQMGAMVVLAGLYDTRSKLDLIRRLKPQTISGTASYLLHLLEVAREMGIETRDLGLRTVGSVGEPGGALAETRKLLAEGWNARIADGYGMTEIFPLGGNCAGAVDLHIASDMAATEIVDPETGEPLPPGQQGEAVFTNLIGDTQPLLRFRSRDVTRIAADAACPACGFTGARLEGSIVGRVDDMIWYRGVNVFPSAVETAVRAFDELGHEYQIVVDGDQALPRMTVRIESAAPLDPAAREALRARAAEAIHRAIRVNAEVELLPPVSLPRADGRAKMRRVVDNRAKA